jgi:hypothetical protein
MKIQNAPLTPEQLERIRRLVINMNNKAACCATTGIDRRTIDHIMKRKWAGVEHIKALMDYCDMVEGFSMSNYAD